MRTTNTAAVNPVVRILVKVIRATPLAIEIKTSCLLYRKCHAIHPSLG